MNHVCLLCERTSVNENLYCQEDYCPAELSPLVFDYGEWLGDIEIIKAVAVLRSAVLYEAIHLHEKVFLKVALSGQEHTDKLKREAIFLRDIQLANQQHENLPVLLPPYASTDISADSSGIGMVDGRLMHYYLFEFSEGDTLRAILHKRPQLWVNHIGWMMIALSRAISFLHTQSLLHCAIMPDAVLVRFDKEPEVPRVLLFDLGIVSNQQLFQKTFVLPAYTAPELLAKDGIPPNQACDVYGLGLTLYEMLVGEPVYTFALINDEEIYHAIRRKHQASMNRIDVQTVAKIAIQSIRQNPSERQKNPTMLTQQLVSFFGEIPTPKPSRMPTQETIFIIIGGLLLIAFLILLAFTFKDIIGPFFQ